VTTVNPNPTCLDHRIAVTCLAILILDTRVDVKVEDPWYGREYSVRVVKPLVLKHKLHITPQSGECQ
jgi:hypothetical protein